MNGFIPKEALGLSWHGTCVSPKFRSYSSFLSAIWIWKQMRFASMFLRCRRSCTQLHAHPCKQSMWFSAALLLPISTHAKPRHVVITSYSTARWVVPCMEAWVLVLLLPGWGRLCLLGDVPASTLGYFGVKASSLEALPFGRKCLNMYCVSEKVRVTVYPGDFQQNALN